MALEYLHSQLRSRRSLVDSDSDGESPSRSPGSSRRSPRESRTPPMPSAVPPRPPPSPGMQLRGSRNMRPNGFSFNEFRSQSENTDGVRGLKRPDLSGLVGALNAELKQDRKFPGVGMHPGIGLGSQPGSARFPPGGVGMPVPPGPGQQPRFSSGPGSARLPVGDMGSPRSPQASWVPSPRGASPTPSHNPPPPAMNPMAFVWPQPQPSYASPSPGPADRFRGRSPDAEKPVRALSGSFMDLEGQQVRAASMMLARGPPDGRPPLAEKARDAVAGMPGPPRNRSPGASYMRPTSPFRSRAFSPTRGGQRQRSSSPPMAALRAVRAAAPGPTAIPSTNLAQGSGFANLPRWSEAPPIAARAMSPQAARPSSPRVDMQSSSETGTAWSWKSAMVPPDAFTSATAPAVSQVAAAPAPSWFQLQGAAVAPAGMTAPAVAAPVAAPSTAVAPMKSPYSTSTITTIPPMPGPTPAALAILGSSTVQTTPAAAKAMLPGMQASRTPSGPSAPAADPALTSYADRRSRFEESPWSPRGIFQPPQAAPSDPPSNMPTAGPPRVLEGT